MLHVAVRVMVLAGWVVAGCATRSAAPPKAVVGNRSAASAAPARCLADGLGPLHEPSLDDDCSGDGTCARRCREGDGHSCVHHGWDVRAGEGDEAAQPWFARGCELGMATGCVAYGEHLSRADRGEHGEHRSRADRGAADASCARRLFHHACEARDDRACVLLARALGTEATAAERATARQFLQRQCSRSPGRFCRLFADELERGQLGPFHPDTVNGLLHSACAAGDRLACARATGPVPTLN